MRLFRTAGDRVGFPLCDGKVRGPSIFEIEPAAGQQNEDSKVCDEETELIFFPREPQEGAEQHAESEHSAKKEEPAGVIDGPVACVVAELHSEERRPRHNGRQNEDERNRKVHRPNHPKGKKPARNRRVGGCFIHFILIPLEKDFPPKGHAASVMYGFLRFGKILHRMIPPKYRKESGIAIKTILVGSAGVKTMERKNITRIATRQ